MARQLPDIVQGFMDFTESTGSPRLFRLWTALFLIGAVMERKTWCQTVKGRLFPNQYVLLVGGPGIGKSQCTRAAYDILEALQSPEMPLHLAPTSVTKASLIDCLAGAERRIVRPMETPSVVAFNALAIVTNELGVFLPAWEGDFMSVLTDLWDCGRYAETRRTSKINIDLPNTQLNLLAADTPSHLTTLLPEGAWDTGFMSRTLIVYSGEELYVDLFQDRLHDAKLESTLVHDFADIYKAYGGFKVTPETMKAFDQWGRAGGPPKPDHPKLQYYCTRRTAHLLKLCMIASMSESNEMVITLDHYQRALDWLLELEASIPDVFKSMRTGGDMQAVEDCWHFAYSIYMKSKAPIVESKIWNFLAERVPAHRIEYILDVMLKAQILEKQMTNSGGTGYIPKMKKPI